MALLLSSLLRPAAIAIATLVSLNLSLSTITMPLLERLQFSIPISTAINAPIDIVWEALTDIQSYPTIFTHYVKTEPLEDRRYSSQHMSSAAPASGGGSVQSGSQPSSQSNAVDPASSSSSLLGSKWLVTRKSVVEKQVFSAKYVVTQYNNHEEDTNNPRSFTLSSHDVLGCTVSVKIIVETTEGPPPSYTEFKRVVQRMSKTKAKSNEHPQPIEASTTFPEHTRVTIIMSLIPFQFFIKLLGVMCCLCLIKSRTRMAAECDLEDLKCYCEEKTVSLLSAGRRIQEEEDGDDMPVANVDRDEDDTTVDVKEDNKATVIESTLEEGRSVDEDTDRSEERKAEET